MTRGSAGGMSAGELLATAIADLADDIAAGRAAAVADEPDAVHQLRTSVRRLRNLLAAFRRCFESGPRDELAAALASYGDLLGRCRDLEVRVADTAAGLRVLDLDELDQPLVGPLRAQHHVAHATMVEWHAGPDVAQLDGLLARWSARPGLSGRATRPAGTVAHKAVRRQAKRVLRRADAAASGDAEARHGLRKAARRLRHTADVVAAVDVEGASRLGRLGHDVQSVLGDHRDALLLAEHARQAAAVAADPAPYDRVVEHAVGRAEAVLAGLDDPLAELRQRVDK